MVNKVTCYANAQPQCAEGERPVHGSHLCIDLLGSDPLVDGLAKAVRLPTTQDSAMRHELAVLTRLQRYLELHDRFVPPSAPVATP